MRILLISVILITATLSIITLTTASNSTESWTAAVLLFASNGLFWSIISASFYDHYKRAKASHNHALELTLIVLVLASAGMAFDSLYAMITTASYKNFVLPVRWFDNFFNKPFGWSFSAIVYNLVAVMMLHLFQSGVIEQVFQEREQRKELEETKRRLEEKNRTLGSIDSISRTLNQSLDLRNILEQLPQLVVKEFKLHLCTVRLINSQNELVVEAAYGDKSSELQKTIQASDAGLAGWVFTQQRISPVYDVSQDHRVSSNDPLLRLGVQSYVGLPIIIPSRGPIGCLEIYSFTKREFNSDELDAYNWISKEAAIAIQNARSYEEAEQRRKELEALNAFKVKIDGSLKEEEIYQFFLNEISKRFQPSQVIILRRDTEGDFMEISASLNPLTKKQVQLPVLEEPKQCRAVRTGKEVIINNVQTDVVCQCDLLVPKQGSYLCQPLTMGGKTLGLVHMSSPHVNYWDMDKQRIISAFASSIAPAISNLRLMDLERYRATTDQLTLLSNRRFLDEHLNKQIQIQRRQQPHLKSLLSVLMLDLDHFKFFNDTFGHEVGDQVLQTFGSNLLSTVRESDLVARYGGEEFCVILHGTDLVGAQETAEKIRRVTEQIDLSFIPKKIDRKITVSIGIAVYPEHANNVLDLLKKADLALYEAKASGRNRVCVAKDGKQPDMDELFPDTKTGKNPVK